MAKFIAGLLTLPIVAILAILGAILGVLGGAFTGWVVGLFFPHTFAAWLGYFGAASFAPWKVGALLGFIGAFFRSSLTSKSE